VVSFTQIQERDRVRLRQQKYPILRDVAGVPLHPKLRDRLDYEAASFPDLTRVSLQDGRRIVREMVVETDRLTSSPPPMETVEEHSIPPPDHHVRIRRYAPKGASSPGPLLLYLHGGGWVFGDLDTHDSLCREIAARSGVVVASLDYRRSHEAKFPAALEDARAAVQWLRTPEVARRLGVRHDQIVVGGDSAGGNMAAVLAGSDSVPRGPPLIGQILICPVTAYFPKTPSYTAYGAGYGLESGFISWMWEQYLDSPRQGEDPHVAPLRIPDLSHAPRALVITAEYDLLRDEGEQYADRLREAGVPTQSTRYDGVIHGFQDYRGLVQEGWDAIEEIAQTLRRWTARSP
jgi:acetyl esterase